MDESRIRHPTILVGPLVTLAAVVALLGIARIYDRLPLRPPECGFKAVLGIPCAGCGGTRSMRALAAGHLVEAVRSNPAVVLGVFVSMAWAMNAWLRFRRGVEPLPVAAQNRCLLRGAIITGAILLLNWIYLLLFLP